MALGLFFHFVAHATVLFFWLAGLAGGLSRLMLLVLCVDSIGAGGCVALELVGLIFSLLAELIRLVLGLFAELVDLALGLFLKLSVLFLRDLDEPAVLMRSGCARRHGRVGGEWNGEGAHCYGDDCTDEYFSTFQIHIYF